MQATTMARSTTSALAWARRSASDSRWGSLALSTARSRAESRADSTILVAMGSPTGRDPIHASHGTVLNGLPFT